MTEYPDWLQRVLDEKKELEEKLSKLRAFDTSKLSGEARALLQCQEGVMQGYVAVLNQRVSLWERENKAKG